MVWRHGSVESIAIEARSFRTEPDELLAGRTLAALGGLLDEPELFALRSLDTRTAGGMRIEPLVELVGHLPIRWLGVTNCRTRDELELLHALPQLDGLGIYNADSASTLAALAGQTWLPREELRAAGHRRGARRRDREWRSRSDARPRVCRVRGHAVDQPSAGAGVGICDRSCACRRHRCSPLRSRRSSMVRRRWRSWIRPRAPGADAGSSHRRRRS